MKLRLYQHRHSPNNQPRQEDDPRRQRLPDHAPEAIPSGIIGASGQSATRDLRQQAVLQMQQQHGNAAVQRYLADLGVLPPRSVQREAAGADNWGDDKSTDDVDDSDIMRKNVMLLTITGEKQGTFKGNSTIAGQVGKIECLTFSMSSNGSGDKSTTTVTIDKETDPSTVQFYQAMANNENLKSVRAEVGKVTRQGVFKPYYLIDMQAGLVKEVRQMGADSMGRGTNPKSSNAADKQPQMDKITMVLGPHPRSSFPKR